MKYLFFIFLLFLLLPSLSPYEMDASQIFQAPSFYHPFGTDRFGRDLFSRVLYGAFSSITIAVSSVFIAGTLGSFLGILSGYYRKFLGSLISGASDFMFSFPEIFLALILVGVLGPGHFSVTVAIAIVYTPIFIKIARASTLKVSKEGYVESAHAIGQSDFIIIWRYIFPNIKTEIQSQAIASLGFAVLAEATLSFLGMGSSPDDPTWGNLLFDAKESMFEAWWVAFFPGLFVVGALAWTHLQSRKLSS